MLLQLRKISKHYQLGDTVIKALDDISISVKKGEFIAIMGPSGSGKSSFLQVASMLAQPSAGRVLLKGTDVTKYDEVERAHLRNKEIGFVFQQFNLLPKTSSIDNVALPLVYAGTSLEQQRKQATQILQEVGLSNRLKNTPAQLSGGQQQRVAIARALVNDPSLIFADEPTGNLDTKSGEEIMLLLKKLNEQGKTIIIVTHELRVAKFAKRKIKFRDGKIIK